MGVNSKDIIYEFHKKQDEGDVILRKMFYENMVIKDGVAYAILTSKMYKAAGTEGLSDFANELLNMSGVKIAFLIKQKQKNTFTVSLRSKQGYNVSKIAEKYGGGGHIQAAGLSFVGAPVKHSKLIFEDCCLEINEKECF